MVFHSQLFFHAVCLLDVGVWLVLLDSEWGMLETFEGLEISTLLTIFTFSATLGFGSATLGNGVARCASGWVSNQFCCSFAYAAEAFANAIFVNSLLTLHSTSAALVSGTTFPSMALVSRCVAWMTIVLGGTLGFVMCWCLKNTVLLILIACVCRI
jgi:hypothetical protein